MIRPHSTGSIQVTQTCTASVFWRLASKAHERNKVCVFTSCASVQQAAVFVNGNFLCCFSKYAMQSINRETGRAVFLCNLPPSAHLTLTEPALPSSAYDRYTQARTCVPWRPAAMFRSSAAKCCAWKHLPLVPCTRLVSLLHPFHTQKVFISSRTSITLPQCARMFTNLIRSASSAVKSD